MYACNSSEESRDWLILGTKRLANLACLVSYRPSWGPSSVVECLLCICKAEFHLQHQHKKQNSKQNTAIWGKGHQSVPSVFRKPEDHPQLYKITIKYPNWVNIYWVLYMSDIGLFLEDIILWFLKAIFRITSMEIIGPFWKAGVLSEVHRWLRLAPGSRLVQRCLCGDRAQERGRPENKQSPWIRK